jgi:hypothetical protein
MCVLVHPSVSLNKQSTFQFSRKDRRKKSEAQIPVEAGIQRKSCQKLAIPEASMGEDTFDAANAMNALTHSLTKASMPA